MKSIITCLLAIVSFVASAQWTTNPATNDAHNNNSSGRVGVGTATPQEVLDVSGDVKIASRYKFGVANAAGGSYAVIGLATGITGKNFMFYNYDGPVHELLTINGTTGNTAINNGGLTVNGSVGIGTTSPSEKLSVNGNINVSLHNSIGYLQSQDNVSHNGNTLGNYSLGWYNDSWAVGAPVGYLSAFGGMKVFTGGHSRFVVTGQGNVGIGTTTPDHKLTVDGGVKCEEVKVEIFQGTGPDYVFEPDYNLLSLSELETYITQNKHLPEVPSAKEMEKEGLNLKEMNLILLKKVEELTLHLIDANHKINRQQKQLDAQHEEIQILKSKKE